MWQPPQGLFSNPMNVSQLTMYMHLQLGMIHELFLFLLLWFIFSLDLIQFNLSQYSLHNTYLKVFDKIQHVVLWSI